MKKFKQFTREDREVMHMMRAEGKSLREISKKLGRGANAAGSISRELKRNQHLYSNVWENMSPLVKAYTANKKAKERRANSSRKKKKKLDDLMLLNKVKEFLEEGASPSDIAYRIPEALPGYKVCGRTIYYHAEKRDPSLKLKFRYKGKQSKQRITDRSKKRHKKGLPDKKRIDERPVVVNRYVEAGHWEADGIVSNKDSIGFAIITLRELATRKTFFTRVANLMAETVLAVLMAFFRMLPEHLRKSLTTDNGKEFEHNYKLERVFVGLNVYYCHPYSPWERGQVENANREFRWFFPKGTDFSTVSREQVKEVQDKINRRHRNCLNGKSADELYALAQIPSKLSFPSDDELKWYSSFDCITSLEKLGMSSSQEKKILVPEFPTLTLENRILTYPSQEELVCKPLDLYWLSKTEEILHQQQNSVYLPPALSL